MSLPDSPTASSPLKFYTPEHGGSLYSSLESSTEDIPSLSSTMSRALSSQQQVLRIPGGPKRPLELLDLPVDILKEIISHLPHANDLTALALCHSQLHYLAIPSIYSRFDIVWPDQGLPMDSRAGVDALTYGLATLVKSQEVFGEAAFQRRDALHGSSAFRKLTPYPLRRRRLGNPYAQYTKKFSLGNGPPDCVKDYLITKEGGKMLGTLVALAVAKMPNLEQFVWDMPTGVLRDVWLSLSSLADREDGEECRLEKVWVRWHNNWQQETASAAPPPPPPNVPPPNLGLHLSNQNVQGHGVTSSSLTHALPVVDRVEHPSFSVLPPLKSLTVLEIDELVYLDEMSILIARSQHCLKELRVGLAKHAQSMHWAQNWEAGDLFQVDYSTTWSIASKIGDERLHGVLGVLVGRVYNFRNNAETFRQERALRAASDDLTSTLGLFEPARGSPRSQSFAESSSENVFQRESQLPVFQSLLAANAEPKVLPLRPSRKLPNESRKNGPYAEGILRLETLELERVLLSIPVLQKAFDWTTLTSLTLLNCVGHERLWNLLRTRYAPKPAATPESPSHSRRVSLSHHKPELQYSLKLTKIHTNTVSDSFLYFIKDTLAPNTLQTLLLQDGWSSQVTIRQIFRDAVRRHRSSLQRLLIDSGAEVAGSFTNVLAGGNRWRKWRLTRRIVAYLTSNKMHNLRELAVSLDYADWHVFLQRLPMISQMRSLYIPHIADHPHGSNLDTHEMAMQIVDIVTLRPEIELCYMGLGTKCFEILENSSTSPRRGSGASSGRRSTSDRRGNHSDDEITDDEDEVSEDDDDMTDDDDMDADMGDVYLSGRASSSSASDGEGGGDGWLFGRRRKAPKLRLQEILFYDKIPIFKARYGRL